MYYFHYFPCSLDKDVSPDDAPITERRRFCVVVAVGHKEEGVLLLVCF